MSNFNFSDCRKATNQAIFRPTAARKAAAAKLLQEALDFINNLEEVAEPSKKAKKASVKEAAESAKAVSVATGAAAKAAKKAALRAAAAERAEVAAQPSVEESRVASLEAKIEALTAVLALHMESTTLPSPSNEVGLDQLPF